MMFVVFCACVSVVLSGFTISAPFGWLLADRRRHRRFRINYAHAQARTFTQSAYSAKQLRELGLRLQMARALGGRRLQQ